jgi:hypothetical protein
VSTVEAIGTSLGAVVVALCALAGALRWIYGRGLSSAKLESAVRENTAATGRLSAALDRTTTRNDEQFLDHERRITRLESR